MIEANFYKQDKNKSTVCDLCNHFCRINNNKTGICGARKNLDGKLFSLVYGYPVTQNVDPIEKKPLYHFYPGSLSYSLGTYGCNFKCANCQNWDISQNQKIDVNIKKLDFLKPEKIIESALDYESKSISYTYNEPTIFTEYALDIMKLAKDEGLQNIWVSNGYMSEHCLSEILPYLDAVNIDLKSFSDDFYKSNCGAKLQPILENIKKIHQEQVHLEITTLIIPGLSDDLEILNEIANFIAFELDSEVPWHLSKFYSNISWKLKKLQPTDETLIYEAHRIGQEAGLKYVYIGNIPGDPKQNTYCPKCGELAISRLGYQIERFDNDGHCVNCDKNLNIIE